MSDTIKRPDAFSGPSTGDTLYIGSLPDGKREVYRQDATGQLTDISGVTDTCEPIDGGFRVGGRKIAPKTFTSERWSADVEADGESSPEMLRGRVR